MLKTLEDIRQRLINGYDPYSIILFGSYGAQHAREHSDIDLLIIKDSLKNHPVFMNSIYRGRYPADEGLLPHGEPSGDESERAVRIAENVFEILREHLGEKG